MEEDPMCRASFFLFSSIPRKKCLYVNKALKTRFIHIKALFMRDARDIEKKDAQHMGSSSIFAS